MSLANRCETCEGEPMWTLLRHGDAVVSWGCADHVSGVMDRLQRDREITHITVTHYGKASEMYEIEKALDQIAAVAEQAREAGS